MFIINLLSIQLRDKQVSKFGGLGRGEGHGKSKENKRGCFHNSCYSNEFEKRMDVRRDVTTQQADDERNDENR